MKRLIVVLGLVAVGPTPLWGQAGQVVDGDSGDPIAEARIVWAPGSEQAGEGENAVQTDTRGRFDLPEGWGPDGHLRVGALGYLDRPLTWDAAREAGWTLTLERNPLTLDDIVVTATGRTQRLSEVALPVETMGVAELGAASAPSVERLLTEFPALQSTGAAPVGSNIMIRGIGDSRVLVLLDGQPAGGALLENRDLSRMSLAGVERVEVVKGPLSSLYGSDALGGVINVITVEPDAGFRADVRAMSGGAGRREASTTIDGGSRAVRYRVTGSWRQEDQVPGLPDALDAFARVWDLRSSLRVDLGERWDLRTDGSLLRERQRWPVGGGFSGFNDNTGITGWAEARRRGESGTLSFEVFGQSYEHLYRSARGDAPIAGGDEDVQQESLIKATAAYAATLGDHRLDVGVEAAHRSIVSPDKIVEDRAEDDQVDVFAQDAWSLGETVASGGVRLTFNDRWGSTASPTVGVTHPLGERFRVRGSVARGFRAPSFKELTWNFANIGAGYTVQGFGDLEPERSWNVSGALEWTPTALVQVEVEAFVNRIRNLIETGFIGNTQSGLLIYSPRNVSRASTQGVELALRVIRDAWDLRAGYAYLDARSLEPDLPLDRRARHSSRVRWSWRTGAPGDLRLDVTGHYTGEAPLIGTREDGRVGEIGLQEPFVGMNLQMTVALPGRVDGIVGVDNVFDARPGGWQATVGRRVRIGLHARELFAN